MNTNPNQVRCSYYPQEISIPKNIQYNSPRHGFIQFGITPSAPDLYIPIQGLGDYVSEWVRIYPRVHADHFAAPSAIGEMIVCHRSIYPNRPKVYTWFPIQAAPKIHGAEIEMVDYIIQKGISYSPTLCPIHIGQWIYPNTHFRHYAPFLFVSSTPLYVQNVISFQRAIWSGTPMFKKTPLRSIYPVVNTTAPELIAPSFAPVGEGASNVCGRILEGMFGKKSSISKITKSKPKSIAKAASGSAKASGAASAIGVIDDVDEEGEEGEDDVVDGGWTNDKLSKVSKERRQNIKILQNITDLKQEIKHLSSLVDHNTKKVISTKEDTDAQINNMTKDSQTNRMILQDAKEKLAEMEKTNTDNKKLLSKMFTPDMSVVLGDGRIVKLADLLKKKTEEVMPSLSANLSTEAPPSSTDAPAPTPSDAVPAPASLASAPDSQPAIKEGLTVEQKVANVNQRVTNVSQRVEKVKNKVIKIETTPIEGGEWECMATDENKKEIEMYNIPVGSAYAGILSQNAMVRMGATLAAFIMLMLLLIVVVPLIKGAVNKINEPNSRNLGHAFLEFTHVSYIVLFLLATFVLSDNLTTKASLFYICFMFAVSLAYLSFIKDNTNDGNIMDLLKLIVYNNKWDWRGFGFGMAFVFVVVLILLISLKLGNIFRGSVMKAMLWSVFAVCCTAVIYLPIGGISYGTPP